MFMFVFGFPSPPYLLCMSWYTSVPTNSARYRFHCTFCHHTSLSRWYWGISEFLEGKILPNGGQIDMLWPGTPGDLWRCVMMACGLMAIHADQLCRMIAQTFWNNNIRTCTWWSAGCARIRSGPPRDLDGATRLWRQASWWSRNKMKVSMCQFAEAEGPSPTGHHLNARHLRHKRWLSVTCGG